MKKVLLICIFFTIFCNGLVYGKTENNNSKVLIVYFSREGNIPYRKDVDTMLSASIIAGKNGPTGNTELIANMIKNEVDADLFEIRTTKSYPVNYRETTNVASIELREGARPPLVNKVKNMDSYDIIFIGYPIWWGTMPMAVFTFLEEYDLSAKTIIPFSTHGGSRFGSSLNDLKKLCPNAKILNGFIVHGSDVQRSQNDVHKWLKSLNNEGI